MCIESNIDSLVESLNDLCQSVKGGTLLSLQFDYQCLAQVLVNDFGWCQQSKWPQPMLQMAGRANVLYGLCQTVWQAVQIQMADCAKLFGRLCKYKWQAVPTSLYGACEIFWLAVPNDLYGPAKKWQTVPTILYGCAK